MLKNAGFVPIEIELLQEIATLKESLASATDTSALAHLRQKAQEKQLQLNLLLEREKRQRRDK